MLIGGTSPGDPAQEKRVWVNYSIRAALRSGRAR